MPRRVRAVHGGTVFDDTEAGERGKPRATPAGMMRSCTARRWPAAEHSVGHAAPAATRPPP
jgi:hypothetical protein